MSLRVAFQRAVIFLVLGSINVAVAIPLKEWEGSAVDNESEDGRPPHGFVDDTMIPVQEEEPVELVEVASPKRQLPHGVSRKDLAMVQMPVSRGKDILDETDTTGVNANRHLPRSVRQETTTSTYLQEINQVTPHLLTIGAHLD